MIAIRPFSFSRDENGKYHLIVEGKEVSLENVISIEIEAAPNGFTEIRLEKRIIT